MFACVIVMYRKIVLYYLLVYYVDNHITDKGLKALLEAMEKQQTIQDRGQGLLRLSVKVLITPNHLITLHHLPRDREKHL